MEGIFRLCVSSILGVCLIGGAWVPPVSADHGNISVMPSFGKTGRSGLSVEVDSRWVDGAGYRPVRIRVSTMPPTPTPADRTIRVELRPNRWSSGFGSTVASERIELPQGSSSVTKTILVPYSHMWNQLEVVCSEGGAPHEELTENFGVPNTGMSQWDNATPSLLFIDEHAPLYSQRPNGFTSWPQAESDRLTSSHDLPDIRRIAMMFPKQSGTTSVNTSTSQSDFQTLAAVFEYPNLAMLPFADLPDDWQAYSSVDVAFIKFDELQKLAESSSKKWEVLREWLSAGGTLVVYGVGPAFAQLRKLEAHLALPLTGHEDDKKAYRGWMAADNGLWSSQIRDLPSFYQQARNQSNTGTPYNAAVPNSNPAVSTSEEAEVKANEKHRPKGVPFVMRECGGGLVLAIDEQDPFTEQTSEYWGWVLNSINQNRWLWHARNGVSLVHPNQEFWNFLIPGVGRAPVGAFLFLISLFMVVIGPVNYYVLRKRGRLVFLLMTVPLGALVVTGALIMYAVLADGLGVRVRVRSYTNLDQTQKKATSWSRQSYYAGLAPSRGMAFAEGSVVYPLEHYPAGQYERRPNRRIDWVDGEQRLVTGFLTSRTTTQFMVTRVCESELNIKIDEGNEKGTAPKAKNELASPVKKVVLCDAHGDLYWGENVNDGDAIDWQPIQETEARGRLSKLLADNEPTVPEGYDINYFANTSSWRRRMSYYPYARWALDPTQTSGILEQSLKRKLQFAWPMERRTYCAILERNREVPLGVKAREEASFHVVSGRW